MDVLYQLYLQFFENVGLPQALGMIMWFIFPFCLTVTALFLIVFLLILLERKVIFPFILRKKNNEDAADAVSNTNISCEIKTLCSNNFSQDADRILFTLAGIIIFAAVFVAWGIVPYSNKYAPIFSGVNVLLFLSVLIFPVLSMILAGVASNNRLSFVKAVRCSALAMSYGLAMMISVLGVVVLASSLNINDIVLAQSLTTGAFGWFFIPSFIGFVVFFIGMFTQINVLSFDFLTIKNDSDVKGGEISIKPVIFVFTEYAAIFVIALFFVCLFLGGYLPPLGFYLSEVYEFNYVFNIAAVYFEQIFWLIAKTIVVVFILLSCRALMPVVKTAKVTKFAWKWLIPFSILNLIVVCVVKYIVGGMSA